MEENKYSAQLRQLKERFGFEFVSLAMVLEAGRPLLTWVYATGNMNTRYRRIMLEPGKGIAGEVYKTGRALIIQNGHAELPEKERVKYPIMLAEGLVSVLAFPMWREERVQGVLLLAFREANLITEDLIDEVAAYITPSFCDYDVHPTTYDQVIRVGEESEIEAVPVYDLVNYQILRAQEEERRRIARDLHDSVVQELIGIQMLLRSIKYQPDLKSVLDLVDQADTRMNQIQNELRSIATSLRPVSLDDLGLVASFRSFFVRIKESHDVTVSFIENIKEKRFAREQEIVFYRVCQEAVLNACKYSG